MACTTKGLLTSIVIFLSSFCMIGVWFIGFETEDTIVHSTPPRLAPEPPGPCSCRGAAVELKNAIPADTYTDLVQRRTKEYYKYKNRTRSELSKVLLAPPNSPLQYPIQGLVVPPLKSRFIPGLALYAKKRSSYKVTLSVTKGVLSTGIPDDTVTVEGNGEATLSLESSSLPLLNALLTKLSYTSTVYHVHTADFATFRFENHEATFPITIKQPQLPIMFDPGNDINSQVTITTKTFLRYEALNIMLSSVRKFYPKIKIIIADDNFEPQTITGDNIEQYIMPPDKGWFAGRNLAVSQVTTKYFLWVDDDFLFTNATKIEKMVEIMEASPELDVVGGSVSGTQFYFTFDYAEGDETEGGCLQARLFRKYHALPGFPKCFLVHGVVNFFLARTDSIQKARFDPVLKREAHPEFFMDGLGSLMVATCKDIPIHHQPRNKLTYHANYAHYRQRTKENMNFRYQLYFFKHNLKCMVRW